LKTLVNFVDIVSRLGNNQARLVVSLTVYDDAVVAVFALVAVERQFIYAHKQKGSFRHVILPTKMAVFGRKAG
jgi:hypothetical protein